jgi:acyl carrier protein
MNTLTSPHRPDHDTLQAIQIRLHEIWVEMLNVRTIAETDNFVELGGDSIAATLCINRIRDAYDVKVPMTTFMAEEMTLGGLAREVGALLAAGQST